MKNLSFFRGWRQQCYILLCLVSSHTFAKSQFDSYYQQQQTQISGTIVIDGSPLPGVTIAVLGKSQSTVSGADGKYTISAEPLDTLVFSYIGFTTVTQPINGRTTIDVTLKEDATGLQEVLVNAGYYTVKEKERTGSISKITAADIEKQPVTNVLAAMQGRMAGVDITQETGLPGGGFSVKIRGVNSLRSNGNSPLYIINGVPYSSDGISDSSISMALPGDGNPLSSINPSDIMSIDILKDADATAIYGSRGANGVVLITTKRGQTGETKFTVSSTYGVGRVTRMLKLMNTDQYLKMRNQAFINDGVEPQFYDYDVNDTWSSTRYTDWQKEFLGGTAETNTWQASATGGSDNTKYLLSGHHRVETTVYPGDSKYRRGGAHFSFDHASVDNRFKLQFSSFYTAQNNRLPGSDLTYLARTLAPNAPALYAEDGTLNWEDNTWDNPLGMQKAVNLSRVHDLVANAVLTWNIYKNLDFKSNFGFTDLRNDESMIYPSSIYNPAYGVGSEYSNATFNKYDRQSWTIEPQLRWHRKYGNSAVDVLVGTTFLKQQSHKLTQLAIGFSSNSLIYDLASASTLLALSNDKVEYNYNAAFGRVNYQYLDRYIINLTGRRDGSSRFGPGNQFANFGALGVAWIYSKEKFLASSDFLSFGKLRFSYGTTGNDQIGDYQFLDNYINSSYTYQGVAGLSPARLFNPGFGWETNTKFEIGLENGFFSDRLLFTAAYYRNRSSSQLVGNPLASTTGFTSIQANLDATVQNTGLEFTLRNVNLQRANFSWTSNFNITLPKNKLLSFPGLESSTYKNNYIVGQPITIKRLLHFTGVNPQTGLYEFEDVNGDGAITSQDDRSIVKDFTPTFYGGLENQLRYKGLELDFLFQFVKQLNYNYAATYGYAGFSRNQPEAYVDSWMAPGDTAAHQIYTTGYNPAALAASGNYAKSDAAVSDASFIRLKNVSLSYHLPRKILTHADLRINVQGQNLLTFTKYLGADPEFKDAGYLPPLRILSCGVQLIF